MFESSFVVLGCLLRIGSFVKILFLTGVCVFLYQAKNYTKQRIFLSLISIQFYVVTLFCLLDFTGMYMYLRFTRVVRTARRRISVSDLLLLTGILLLTVVYCC